MLKRIHVNRHHIAANKKDGGDRPVYTVKTYKDNTTCHDVTILGPSKMIYRPAQPLACGATVWIETHSEVLTA